MQTDQMIQNEKSAGKENHKAPILVFGDNEAQELAKMTWSALHGQEIEIRSVQTVEELRKRAPKSCLVLLFIGNMEGRQSMSSLYDLVPDRNMLCADFIAVSDDTNSKAQIDLLAQGYDAVFDMDFIKSRDFTVILQKRIEKSCERLQMKAAWAEYETFKAALNASPDSYILFDQNNRLVYASSHYYKAYPQTAGRLNPGTSLDDIYNLLAKEQGVYKDDPQYGELKAFWQQMNGEMNFYLPNSQRIWRLRGRQLPNNQGSIVITTDITEQEKQQELLNKKSEDLEMALAESEEANEIQKQFINMVSHEFRTPLTIIDGNTQILQKRGVRMEEKDFQKRCKTIRSAVSRLIYIMESVLSSNMMRTGRFELLPEEVDLKSLVTELCEEFSDISPKLNIESDIEGLPDIVYLDRKVLTLVLTNLLSNAVKFSKEAPEVNIAGHTEKREHDNNIIVIEVSDNGVGIPEKEQDKIFDRYYRASTASGIAGTGIGLNLVKDLLELHSGQIDVQSKEDQGTKFVVKLPLNGG